VAESKREISGSNEYGLPSIHKSHATPATEQMRELLDDEGNLNQTKAEGFYVAKEPSQEGEH